VAALLLPRLAWLTLATAVVVWLVTDAPDRGWLVAAAAAPVPFLLRRAAAPAWSLPALAPALGLVGLAGAYPAACGRLAGPLHRAAAGALGAWWLLLAEPPLQRRLLLGAPRDAGAGWHAVQAVATSPAIALAGVWAVGAAVLPLLVRGRVLTVDIVGATAWSAGVAAAAQATLGGAPPGLIVGAIGSGALALALRGRVGPSRGASDTR
jgi:hypothetical protein